MTFAEYTAGDEIGWSAESIVYEAQPTAGPGAQALALKVRGYHQESEGAALLEAGREQERAVAAGCVSIVPILALGLERHSVYTVTPRYPYSLLSLIEGKVAVVPEGLEMLAAKVLAALRQLRDNQGRAHGRITPANILITGSTRLRDGDFFLSDFSPEKSRDYAADIHAFGRVFYYLIRRREIESFDWPIAHSTHWAALGDRCEEIRAFCNALLDPALPSMPDPIVAAERALVKLIGRSGKSFNWKPLALGVGALAVAAGLWWTGRAYLSREHAPSTPPPDPGRSEAWVARLAEELASDPQGTGGDTYLEVRVAYPVRNLNLDSATRASLKDGKSHSEAAKATAQEVHQALVDWDSPKIVQDEFNDYNRRGWRLPAASLNRLLATATPGQPILPRLRDQSRAAAEILQVRMRWRELQPTLDELRKSGEPFLARLPDYVQDEAANAPDLGSLLDTLTRERDELPDLPKLLAAADQARLRAEGKLPAPTGPLTTEIRQSWKEEVRRYTPNPPETERLRLDGSAKLKAFVERIPLGNSTLRTEAEQERARFLASLKEGALPVDTEALQAELPVTLARLEGKFVIPPPPVPITIHNNPPTPPPSPPEPTAAPKDRDFFDKAVAQLRTADLTRKSVREMEKLRSDFVQRIRNATALTFQKDPGIAGFLARMDGLSLQESAAAPQLPGPLAPTKTPSGVVYLWKEYRLEFTLIPGDGERSAVYLAAQELPIGLLFDWTRAHGGNFGSLKSPERAQGPCGWQGGARGFAVRGDWSWATTLIPPGGAFYPKGQLPAPPNARTPLNYLTSQDALSIAKQFGARLPSPDEWKRGFDLARSKGWEGSENLRDLRWAEQQKHVQGLVAVKEVPDPPWPDGDIFVPREVAGVPNKKNATPASGGNDGELWFHPTEPNASPPLRDLVGNVAEFVADGEGAEARLYVIGGSALSPHEVVATNPYQLNPAQKAKAFSDVGMRLALSAGGGSEPVRRKAEDDFRAALQAAP